MMGSFSHARLNAIVGSIAIAAVMMLSFAPPAGAQNVCDQASFQSRPIELGTSGGNINSIDSQFCCSGTLGALVQDAHGAQYILSNNHVLGRTNRGRRGEPIIQPGLADLSCAQNTGDEVATLSRKIKISFGRSARNTADAAIAHVVSGDVSGDILNIGPISASVVAPPRSALGMSVQKMGAASCLTTGVVSAVNVTGVLQYPNVCSGGHGTAVFAHQILITPGSFAESGDSGSLVVTTEACPRAVGLVFAGSQDGSNVLANPINYILQTLHVKMAGGCTSAATSAAASPKAAASPVSSAANSTASSESPATSISSPPSSDAIDSAAAVQEKYHDQMMKIPGVVGTGVGFGDHATAVIEVFVTKKTDAIRSAVPNQLDGIPVRIVPTGNFVVR